MAYTILQQPTTPNVTNTNLVYTVSSSNSLLPQFNFTSNLYYSGSSTKLTGFTFSSNKLKTGTIDLARPLGDYLSFDYNWKINNSSSLDNSVKQFDVKFGENCVCILISPNYAVQIGKIHTHTHTHNCEMITKPVT